MKHFAKYRMNLLVGLIIFLVAHHWFTQKDLITYVIKNTMITRQQTQLKGFFGEQNDPMYVCDDKEGGVVFCNPAGLSLFRRAGCLEVRPNIRLFNFKKGEINEISATFTS